MHEIPATLLTHTPALLFTAWVAAHSEWCSGFGIQINLVGMKEVSPRKASKKRHS